MIYLYINTKRAKLPIIFIAGTLILILIAGTLMAGTLKCTGKVETSQPVQPSYFNFHCIFCKYQPGLRITFTMVCWDIVSPSNTCDTIWVIWCEVAKSKFMISDIAQGPTTTSLRVLVVTWRRIRESDINLKGKKEAHCVRRYKRSNLAMVIHFYIKFWTKKRLENFEPSAKSPDYRCND